MIRRIAEASHPYNLGHAAACHAARHKVRWTWRAGAICACLLAAAPLMAQPADAACTVQARTTVPLQRQGADILVVVQVNGRDATFMLDTGAQRSLVTKAAVQRLDLARDEWVGTTMRGIGGIESRPNADPRSLSLGGVPLVRRTLNHDTSLTVGVLPHASAGGIVIDGLLGRDFLSLFDLDIDVPSRQLTLYHVEACSGRFLPWSFPYTSLGITMPAEQAVMLPVTLDGVTLQALLDTGANASLVAAPGLIRLGLQPGALAGDRAVQVSGLGPRIVTMRLHQFRAMTIGGETRQNPVLWVAPIRLSPFADMLVGADWLSQRRVWLSFATKQLFIATNSSIR